MKAKKYGLEILKRLLALGLCLALLAGCALAETEVAELSKGPDRELYYQGIPMKDGRLLLNGRTDGKGTEGQIRRHRRGTEGNVLGHEPGGHRGGKRPAVPD